MLVAHHTWRPTADEWAGMRSILGIQKFYQQKGWDAAPHLFVAPDGIWLFTPMHQIGIHANAANSWHAGGRLHYSIGMEMVGDFDNAKPTGPVWEGAKAVIGGLSMRLGIAPRELVRLHREFNKDKTCPGRSVDTAWIVAEVDAWLRTQRAASLPGADRAYTCDPSFVEFYNAHGGVLVFGMPLGDQHEAPDSSGEVCRWVRCENAVLKKKPSMPDGWKIRPASIAELLKLGIGA